MDVVAMVEEDDRRKAQHSMDSVEVERRAVDLKRLLREAEEEAVVEATMEVASDDAFPMALFLLMRAKVVVPIYKI